jgi:hypothetical protein
MSKMTYRATVESVSTVDVGLRLIPAPDGETPFVIGGDERLLVNVPGAACGEKSEHVIRDFGRLFGIDGAVLITIEPDPSVICRTCGSDVTTCPHCPKCGDGVDQGCNVCAPDVGESKS